jgi:hypothetical protein
MAVNLYRSDGTTLLDGISTTNEEAGADSDAIAFKVKNDGETDALNVILVQRTVDPGDPNTLLATGVPPQDEGWGRVRITGFTNTAEPTWSVNTTDWTPLGAFSPLLVGDIPPDCLVHCEYKSHPPSSAETGPWVRSIVPIYNEYSQPLPPSLTRVDRGILTGVGDFAHSGLVSGLGVTVSGSPDDEVHSAAGVWVHKGILYGDIAQDHAFTDEDSAAAALASGEHYWAVISRGAGAFTVTKGTKGAAATKPALPAGEVFVRYVRIDYQAAGGGVPVIEAADLDGTTLYDRYLAEDGGSLDLSIHPGQAQGGSTWRYSGGMQTLPLTDDDTNYVWQLASGLFDATLDTVPPEGTAIGPLWEVLTASGSISTITDRRIYAGRTVELRLSALLTGGTGLKDSIRVGHERLFLDKVLASVSDDGDGSSGSTVLDIHIEGATIYTSSGTDDQRPTFAFDAGSALADDGSVPEVRELRQGYTVQLHLDAEPVGGTPVSAEVILVCRVP